MAADMDSARARLRQIFGYDDFRPGQVDVVASVLAGADTLGVLPTGGGKSLCYQVPALVLEGLTVVISPLISLMKDQVDRLVARGVSATFLNSTLPPAEAADRLRRARDGVLKLLYVAPERFEAADLQAALARSRVSLLAVDEAHCISEWGHDFRPSFRRIAEVRDRLRITQTIALTATATPVVRADIRRQLRLREPRVIVGGFDRINLSYSVCHCRDDAQKTRRLVEALRAGPRPCIVYASTRSAVERVARAVSRSGIRALPYHAGLEDSRRQEVQDAFMNSRVDAIVATNAFGMGIDKPDVRLVLHFAMPGNLEAYYQEAGRAGRDGAPARCVLLHEAADRLTHEWFIAGMYPSRAIVERVYDRARRADPGLRGMEQSCSREERTALSLLDRERILWPREPSSLLVRVIATPTRIRRELTTPADARNRAVLRKLWALAGGCSDTCGVSVGQLGVSIASAHAALRELRDRQFVTFTNVGPAWRPSQPRSPLDDYGLDWTAMTRRRESDLLKLEMMERYALTRECRRAFVLRYFGDRDGANRASRASASGGCGGCDNCQS